MDLSRIFIASSALALCSGLASAQSYMDIPGGAYSASDITPDGEIIDVRPGMAVLIPPGVRHRAVGEMKVLIVVLPKFDPADEWFD